MTPLPLLPAGDTKLIAWAKQMMRCIIERTIVSSPDVMVESRPSGITLRIKQKSSQGGSSGDKPVWL